MRILTPVQRRELRAKAHHLHPVVTIGQHGLTPAVLHEIDVALTAHELVKVRVFSDDRDARDALLAQVCTDLDAAPVQHVGKIIIVWRPIPESVAEPAAPPRRAAAHRAPARPRRPKPAVPQASVPTRRRRAR